MSVKFTGVNLSGLEFGPELGDRFGTTYFANPKSAFDYWDSNGANTVRLPFLWERLQTTSVGPLDSQYLQLIKDAVAHAKSNGQVLILDLLTRSNLFDEVNPDRSEEKMNAFVDVWTKLANEFKDDVNVWFGLMNEPTHISAADWMLGAQAATNAIRATGAENKILVPTVHWSGAFRFNDADYRPELTHYEAFSDPANNFAFEVHQYLDWDHSGRSVDAVAGKGSTVLQGVTAWARQNQFDIFVGEFGVTNRGANPLEYRDFLSYMDQNSDVFLGWTAWGAGNYWPEDYTYYMGPLDKSGEGILKPYFNLSPIDYENEANANNYQYFAGTTAADTIRGGITDDRIYGGSGNDTLVGDAGNDELYGGHGDDLFNAGWGRNRVDGGDGIDTLVLDGNPNTFSISGNKYSLTASSLDGRQSTQANNIEKIYWTDTGQTTLLSEQPIDTGMTFGLQVLHSGHISQAHAKVDWAKLIQLAASAGSKVVRIPTDLSKATDAGYPEWHLNFYNDVLTAANQYGLKVIFQPGQTPADLSFNGTVSGEPGTYAQMEVLAQRFAKTVEQIYKAFPQYAHLIQAWEIGNEPNLGAQYYGDSTYFSGSGDPNHPRFYVVDSEQGTYFADYLALIANAVANVEPLVNRDIKVISGGVAHNDYAYLEKMLIKLREYGADVDGFAIHPYTIYPSDSSTPSSLRPTEWVPESQNDYNNSWKYYHSFQGALYSIQSLMNKYGYGNAELNITEFGVPSYSGYRGAGAEGRLDQAYWYAEALGVVDSWDNANLKTMIAHQVLDLNYAWQNDNFNAYDNNSSTPQGTTSDAEGSFGFFEMLDSAGQIVAKPVIELFRAISNNVDYSNASLRILNRVTSDTLDLTTAGSNGKGITNGYVVLTHGGNDIITGSNFDDSLFAGAGDDNVNGGEGNDRIYGGSGNDTLVGYAGNDDIYGNHGDDLINGGWGINRIDGGVGFDILVLDGRKSSFNISGDGNSFTAISLDGRQNTHAINVEKIYWTDNGETLLLNNADINRGNGGVIPAGMQSNQINGSERNDVLNGSGYSDIIFGLAGNDFIFGGAGNDVIHGGSGNDDLFGQLGDDELVGGEGYDQAIYDGGLSDYSIVRTADGALLVRGPSGTDILRGIEAFWFNGTSSWYSQDIF